MNCQIYPKQFRSSRIPIEKNRCFMLMPFSSKFDMIYGEIKSALLNNDFVCSRADEIFGSVPIMSNVLNGILQAHFVIADLTSQNPNVFYELGVAHSFKDAHNIILISQNINDVPFDIRHLSTIIYHEDNIKLLTARIIKTIKENMHFYTFFESLQKKSIISAITDDKYEFLETLQEHIGSNISLATDVLNGKTEVYSESEIRKLLDICLGALYHVAAKGLKKQLPGIMRVISAILCQCEEFNYASEIVKHLLYEIKLENYPMNRSEIILLQTELAVSLASSKVYFSEAMSWIIAYFARSKSATVDLNRYNLEKFLLTSVDIDVDSAIVNSILHDNYYIREHMADMIGEKKLLAGVNVLIIQLERENNIYTTSSIITALGKLGNPVAYPAIVEWFERNKERLLKTQHHFILKHIFIAFSRLKISNDFTERFQREFAEYLTPIAIS